MAGLPYGTIMGVDWNIPTTPAQEYAIKGEMLVVQHTYTDLALVKTRLTDREIKRQLISDIVEKMMDSKFIEFTKAQDPLDFNTIIRARCFLVPDTQVRILRENGVK